MSDKMHKKWRFLTTATFHKIKIIMLSDYLSAIICVQNQALREPLWKAQTD